MIYFHRNSCGHPVRRDDKKPIGGDCLVCALVAMTSQNVVDHATGLTGWWTAKSPTRGYPEKEWRGRSISANEWEDSLMSIFGRLGLEQRGHIEAKDRARAFNIGPDALDESLRLLTEWNLPEWRRITRNDYDPFTGEPHREYLHARIRRLQNEHDYHNPPDDYLYDTTGDL